MSDDLEQLNRVGSSTADSLKEGGYNTHKSIAVASASEISERADVGESTALKIINSARKMADIGGFQSAAEVAEEEEESKDLDLFPSSDSQDLSDSEEEFFKLLNGGIKTQSITEFSGRPGSGKTQSLHQLCVNVQLPVEVGGLEGKAIYIDTEDTFSAKRIKQMVNGLKDNVKLKAMEARGISTESEGNLEPTDDDSESMKELRGSILEGIKKTTAHTSDHQILLTEKAKKIASQHDPEDHDTYEGKMPYKLLVVDSLTSHFRSEYVGRGNLAERQQKINKNLRVIGNYVKTENAIAVYANQVQADPQGHQWGGPQTVGGNVVGHKKDYEIRVKPSKKNRVILKLQKAPDLPEGEVQAKITTDGVKPV